MSRWGKKARPPEGFEYLEPTLAALEAELREKVNEPHEGKRKCEALWPVHQINWQRSRYIYDMFYRYKRISRQVYEYCTQMKLCDAALAAKWKKTGYEKLCCTHAINSKNFKFGTVSICRVPKKNLSADATVEDQNCGCRGCASGEQGESNIFGNKYGQFLASIQIRRERRQAKALAAVTAAAGEGGEGQGRVNGEAGEGAGIWAGRTEEAEYDAEGDDSSSSEEEEGLGQGVGAKRPGPGGGQNHADREVEAVSTKKMKA